MKPILFLLLALTIAGCRYRPHGLALNKEYSAQIQDYPSVPDSVAMRFLSPSEKELWKSDSGDTPSSLNRDDLMRRRGGLFASDSMLGISENALLELLGQPTSIDLAELRFETS